MLWQVPHEWDFWEEETELSDLEEFAHLADVEGHAPFPDVGVALGHADDVPGLDVFAWNKFAKKS